MKMTNEQKYKMPEERVNAFVQSKGGHLHHNMVDLYEFARWLALEAEDEKIEPCPFCGESPRATALYAGCVVICDCGYLSKPYSTEAAAIAAHNRVARAVRAEKESEVSK